MEQEHRITYKAGITRRPSDFLCQDGELAECINLTTDSEELKPIVQPKAYIEVATPPEQYDSREYDRLLVYVHSHNNVTRYIFKDIVETSLPNNRYVALLWTETPNDPNTYNQLTSYNTSKDKVDVQAQSIGNTLILSLPTISYFFWKGGGYKYLGNSIPDIDVEFSLGDFGYLSGADENPNKYGRIPGMHGEVLHEMEGYQNIVGNVWGSQDEDGERKYDSGYESGKNALIGIVSSQLNWIKEKKRFAFPFWARAAVRLTDGTHINITNPFLLLPTVLNNWHIFAYDDTDDKPMPMTSDAGGWWLAAYRPYCARLYYKTVLPAGEDLSDWEDIISGIDIFVSQEVRSFDIEGGWTIVNNFSRPDAFFNPQVTADCCSPGYSKLANMPILNLNDVLTWQTFYKPSLLSEGEMTKRLIDNSVFYKIIELDRNDIIDNDGIVTDATDKIDRGVLKNLVNSVSLKSDDYYSRSRMIPQVIKAYNSRLHLADFTRSFFAGFTHFSYTAHSDRQSCTFVVYIKTDDGVRIVKSGENSIEIGEVWFYYPDPRAFKAEIYAGSNKIYTLSLKEHPHLNGAYYFGHLPDSVTAWPGGTASQQPDVENTPEMMEGQIMVSEVDNPWVYTASGHVRVGKGRIMGIASQTVALGQEEHGIHPLIVFSERGISALRLDDEGKYKRSDELSREICINGNIIETDGAVFFVSKKGLMMIVGETVKCVSGQMNGAAFEYKRNLTPLATDTEWDGLMWDYGADADSFLDYIRKKDTFMAYDYIDSRIYIINPSYKHAYVYNAADGTISKTLLPTQMDVAVSYYPDCLLQGIVTRTEVVEGQEQTVRTNKIFSLYNKFREDQIGERQLCFLLTRPMKLAGPVSQASLRQLKNVGVWNKGNGSVVKTEVYLSEDMQKWYPDTSRFGAAARYYRLALFIKMLPSERLSGTVITSQERRGNNMR